MKNNNSLTFVDTKPHYALLDGLRGVAALLVVWYHIFEGYAFAGGIIVEVVNHGYLAVDFFFILSGFVISYAYFQWITQTSSYSFAPYGYYGGTDWDCCILHTGTYAMEWNTGAISYHNRLVIARAVFYTYPS